MRFSEIASSRRQQVKQTLPAIALAQFVDQEQEQDMQEQKLSGVTARPFDEPELTAYLDRTIGRDKQKQDRFQRPYIHASNVPIVDEQGRRYDLDALKSQITTRPDKILKQNEKMVHSDGSEQVFFNVSLPALKGLAVDESTGKFVIIDTCPGAGSCKTFCYALKGGYVQWKAVSLSQTKMLNFLYNDPTGFMEKLSQEIDKQKNKFAKKNVKVAIRWHDAGDFFSQHYLDLAFGVARNHPDVDFYAYTKIAGVAQQQRPDNFIINFSMGAQRREEKKIDFVKTKHSKVVPRELFYDLIKRDGNRLIKDSKGRMQFDSPAALSTFKTRMAQEYNIDPGTILTHDEMLAKPKSAERNKYNVIVMPGDGDSSANRADVLGSYLLIH